MRLFEKYLNKHQTFTSFNVNGVSASSMVVVIPVYREDNLLSTLKSLFNCNRGSSHVAVFLIFNASENASASILKEQKETIEEVNSIKDIPEFIKLYSIEAFDLPQKHFGAGLARKIGMDLAVQHFYNTSNKNGVIVSLDADSTVDENYLVAIEQYFSHPEHNGCSIYFEHPVEGEEFDHSVYDAITQYELHLRYYVESLKYIEFPYAYHTVGSCFAVKAQAYVSAGGMNRRQGGEEFYFIQKLVQLGGYGELNSTTVYPSSRISTRVPFGTGPSVKLLVENKGMDYLTYNLQGFIDLNKLFETVGNYYQISEEKFKEEVIGLPGRVRSFLLNSDFYNEISAISSNCSNLKVFEKRFYQVFNAFKLVKYINYIHEHFLEKVPVYDAAIELLQLKQMDVDDIFEEKELLEVYRNIQKCDQ